MSLSMIGASAIAIKVSSEKIGDTTYFDRLFDDIKDPLVLRDFYDYLGTVDLSAYNGGGMQFNIPKTAFWRDCVLMGASAIHTFLSAFINKHIEGPSPVIQVLGSSFRSDLHDFQQISGSKLTQIPRSSTSLARTLASPTRRLAALPSTRST